MLYFFFLCNLLINKPIFFSLVINNITTNEPTVNNTTTNEPTDITIIPCEQNNVNSGKQKNC